MISPKFAILVSIIIVFSVMMRPSAYATGYDLCFAAEQGNFAEFKKALKGGANPDHKCIGGKRSLHIVTEHGHVGMVDALLNAGANPKLKDSEGNTALDVALREANYKIFKILKYGNKSALDSTIPKIPKPGAGVPKIAKPGATAEQAVMVAATKLMPV